MVKHPQNGPSFSKTPAKNTPRKAASSPAQRDAARAEAARDAAKERLTHKDLAGWAIEQLRKREGKLNRSARGEAAFGPGRIDTATPDRKGSKATTRPV